MAAEPTAEAACRERLAKIDELMTRSKIQRETAVKFDVLRRRANTQLASGKPQECAATIEDIRRLLGFG
jgi:hypothetical protein